MMTTLIELLVLAVSFAIIIYLFVVLPDVGGTEQGKCSAKDYEIAEKIAARKN